MIRVLISGLGKTGKEIAKVLLEQVDIKVVAAICSSNGEKKNKDLGEIIGCNRTGIVIDGSDNLEQAILKTRPEVAVDFSVPEAAIRNAEVFSRMKVSIVIGTTGFSSNNLTKLFTLANNYKNAIICAPNITLGVNVLMLLSNLAANILNNYDFQITEVHHKYKKDAPSGTAKKIAVEIEKGLKSSGSRNITTGIPITAIRAGGVVGKHEVMIIGEDDEIHISHCSFSRRIFAIGALRAIRFAKGKCGFFEMKDVLDLQKVFGDYLEKEEDTFEKRFMSSINAGEV